MRRTVFANAGLTAASLRRWRFRLVVFFVRIWFLRAWRRRTLPVPVRRKRFAAPRWDLSLGTVCVSPGRGLRPPRISINRSAVERTRVTGRGKIDPVQFIIPHTIANTREGPASFRTNSRFRARLQLVERQPSVLLVRAVGAVAAADDAVRGAAAEGARAWAGAADPGLRAQRGAAAGGAPGTGLRDSGGDGRNGVTAERAQLTKESAWRGVSASRAGERAGPEHGAERHPRHRRQAPGTHARCPKHPATGLVTAKYGKSPVWSGSRGDLGSTYTACLTLLL